jgi:hypothetical protein
LNAVPALLPASIAAGGTGQAAAIGMKQEDDMNKWQRLMLGVCAVGLCAPLAAFAGKGGKGGGKHGAAAAAAPAAADAPKAPILAFDKNGNRVIDEDEKEALKAALSTEKKLKRYDTDKDGTLSDTEIAAIKIPGKHRKK